ncbi:hypothetical protein PINS_up020064 [Pythium insidiosum]|nr:hypothetical protein PINS_up020064 [Pythium insidiosum]
MAAFARELARRLQQQQQQEGRSVKASELLVNGSTWSAESVSRQRSAFVVAVKSALALAANVSVSSSRVELLLRVWRWTTDEDKRERGQERVLAVDTRFFFHFVSAAEPQQTRTLPSGSRVAVSGVFLQPTLEADAEANADAAWGVAIALSQQTSPAPAAAAAASASAPSLPSDAYWQLSDRAELLLVLLHRLLHASSSPLVPTFALELLGLALEIHQFLTLRSDLATVSSAQPALQSQHVRLQSRLERGVIERAAVGAASSALSGLAPLLRSLLTPIARGAKEGEEEEALNLARAFDALVLLARPLLRDLAASPTALALDLDPTRVDLRVDVALALERRQYAASVAAECVIAQFLADCRVDVAMESALMSSLASGLPPNPFVAIARHLRVFALRHWVSRSLSDDATSDPQQQQRQRRPQRVTLLARSPPPVPTRGR